MIRLAPRSFAPLLTLALAACGGVAGEPVDGEPVTLSLTQEAPADVQSDDAWQALESCTPDPELETHQDVGDVRLASVELVEGEAGDPFVEVTLANVAPVMALGYPGAVVEVVSGDAQVGASPFEPSAQASWPMYGIEACSTAVAPIALVWGEDDEAKLLVRAVSGFEQADGETEHETLLVTVTR